MKKLLVLSLLLVGSLAAVPAQSRTCTPYGTFCLFGVCYYDHISNGDPTSLSCWTTGTSLATISTCGYSQSAFDMFYGTSVSQDITVGAGQTGTTWDFGFYVDFDDPHNDGAYNNILATVYNVTNSATIGTWSWNGANGDLSCSRKDITFSGNYAGKTLRVTFTSHKACSDTYIRVRNIFLDQNVP